jgi:beta-glucosidase
MITILALATLVASVHSTAFGAAEQQHSGRPWMDPGLDPDSRTRLLLAAMTRNEKLALVFGYFSSDAPWKNFKRPAAGLEQSAGYIGGIARLGIPALLETDAGIGVASQPGPHPRLRTALPSNLAIAASWDLDLAYAGGRMIGNEARQSGFNVMLAGGINLAREPRNGRNFEYGGEDPLLAANIVGAQIRGIQSNHIISTIKHFALNDQETNRTTLSVQIDERAARMSDLLAFEMAIGIAQPGAVMCAYNRINGVYSCENPWLLDEVLKHDWGYKGFVMSDWGATHSSIPAATAGLDQESGFPFDVSPYFADALQEAVEDGYVPSARLDDMTGRILRSMFVNGLFDAPLEPGEIDFAAHARTSRTAAEESMVLLKNARHLLPLDRNLKSLLLVGSHADVGVLSGGGSSQVYPPGGAALVETRVGGWKLVYFRSSPLEALAAHMSARTAYDPGSDIKAAAALASLRCGHRVRTPVEHGRDRRYDAPGRGSGRSDHRCGQSQLENHCRARDRRPGDDAVARRSSSRTGSMVSGLERGRGHRAGVDGGGQSIRPTAADFSTLIGAVATACIGRLSRAAQCADFRRLPD